MSDTAAEMTEPRQPPLEYLQPRSAWFAGWCHVWSYLPAIDPFTNSSEHIWFYSARIFVFVSDIFSALDLQCSSEPTPFHPLFLLILVQNRVSSINKDCSLNNSLQTYYRIPGPTLNGNKDMVPSIWSHSTVTIDVLNSIFSDTSWFWQSNFGLLFH
jgi:hypothetical protein